jgi:hypothetical protein
MQIPPDTGICCERITSKELASSKEKVQLNGTLIAGLPGNVNVSTPLHAVTPAPGVFGRVLFITALSVYDEFAKTPCLIVEPAALGPV